MDVALPSPMEPGVIEAMGRNVSDGQPIRLWGKMSSKYMRYLALLTVALIVIACSPRAASETTGTSGAVQSPATSVPRSPTASATLIPPTSTPAPSLETSTSGPGDVGDSSPGQDEVPMGFTEDGAPYRGDPNAPVTLMEYSDFQ
jgi:hypothetical protein